uniref:Putative ovule protein n=1 Tax=Solanum chacoense TaxID=4108 RepID=A0A0V0GWP1_SOLCH
MPTIHVLSWKKYMRSAAVCLLVSIWTLASCYEKPCAYKCLSLCRFRSPLPEKLIVVCKLVIPVNSLSLSLLCTTV